MLKFANRESKQYPVMFKFRNYEEHIGFYLSNFEFEPLLLTICPKTLMHIVSAMLLEQKIVLVKDEVNEMALIM
jgi:hypothetical protein